MNKGMMWFDDDKNRSLEEKIGRAGAYYLEKYGITPNLCCVNTTVVTEEFSLEDIAVKPHKFIRPQHFWIGQQA